MHKLIIFSALIACALATWAPASKHDRQHPHQSIAAHSKGVEHPKPNAVVSPGHNVRSKSHGQLESVHHAGATLHKNKEFKRTKKRHHDKLRDANKGRNHLRRVRSEKHH